MIVGNDTMGEHIDTDLASWVLGPYHGALPGPMRLHLELDGEIIVRAAVETGYLHRGLEKCLELQSWPTSIVYADRLDPETAIFGELALCLAVEEVGKIEIPKRAECIRIILSELARISSHLGYVARVARSVGADTVIHYVLRDREKILDLFELLTGVRFSPNFLRYGGVSADVTEGFIERVQETTELIRIRLKEYNDVFSFNCAFLKRATDVGAILKEQVVRFGITGPNARASSFAFDVRKAHPYSGYEKVDFGVPVGQAERGLGGDAHERFIIRLKEVGESLKILKQATESIPTGEFCNAVVNRSFIVPTGEAYSRIESPRGLLGCYVASDGTLKPSRVQFRVPSTAAVEIIPELIVGASVEDLPVVLASMDISIAEVDR